MDNSIDWGPLKSSLFSWDVRSMLIARSTKKGFNWSGTAAANGRGISFFFYGCPKRGNLRQQQWLLFIGQSTKLSSFLEKLSLSKHHFFCWSVVSDANAVDTSMGLVGIGIVVPSAINTQDVKRMLAWFWSCVHGKSTAPRNRLLVSKPSSLVVVGGWKAF